MVRGAFYLLGRDLGTVAELDELSDEVDLWAIRETFITEVQAVAQEQGYDEVRPALYNLVMSTILRTLYSHELHEDAAASFTRSSRTLRVRLPGDPVATATLLVHEAAHGWLDTAHVECPDGYTVQGDDVGGLRACDQDWSGAYGLACAAARLMYNGVPGYGSDDGTWLKLAEEQVELESAFILAD